MIKKTNLMDSMMDLGKAAASGMAAKFVTQKISDLAVKNATGWGKNVKPWMVDAAPLIGSYFLLQQKGMEPIAFGIAGASGASIGHDFGIYGLLNGDGSLNDNTLNGMFSEYTD